MDIKELVDLCKKGNEQALSLLYLKSAIYRV